MGGREHRYDAGELHQRAKVQRAAEPAAVVRKIHELWRGPRSFAVAHFAGYDEERGRVPEDSTATVERKGVASGVGSAVGGTRKQGEGPQNLRRCGILPRSGV